MNGNTKEIERHISNYIKMIINDSRFKNCIIKRQFNVPVKNNNEGWSVGVETEEKINFIELEKLIKDNSQNDYYSSIIGMLKSITKGKKTGIIVGHSCIKYDIPSILRGILLYWHREQKESKELSQIVEKIANDLISNSVSITLKGLLGNIVLLPESIDKVEINDIASLHFSTEEDLFLFFRESMEVLPIPNWCKVKTFKQSAINSSVLTFNLEIDITKEKLEKNYFYKYTEVTKNIGILLNCPLRICEWVTEVKSFIPITNQIESNVSLIEIVYSETNPASITSLEKKYLDFVDNNYIQNSIENNDFKVPRGRLHKALVGYDIENKIIDLSIALECLLLKNHKRGEKKTLLQERASFFFKEKEKNNIREKIGQLYEVRNDIIHNKTEQQTKELDILYKENFLIIRIIYLFLLEEGKIPNSKKYFCKKQPNLFFDS